MAKLTLLLVVSALVLMATAVPVPTPGPGFFDDDLDLFPKSKSLFDKDDFFKKRPTRENHDNDDFADLDKGIKSPSADDIENMKPDKNSHVEGTFKEESHSVEMVNGKVVNKCDKALSVKNKDGKVTKHEKNH